MDIGRDEVARKVENFAAKLGPGKATTGAYRRAGKLGSHWVGDGGKIVEKSTIKNGRIAERASVRCIAQLARFYNTVRVANR